MAEDNSAKRIKELEQTIASQEAVIADQVEKLEMAALTKKIKAETFTRDGKIYKINHPSIIIPLIDDGKSRKVTSAEIAKDAALQDALFAIDGCNAFTEVSTGSI